MNNETHNPEEVKGEIVPVESAISLIHKAEIDMQISTAKTFPRSLTKFKRSLLSMATMDEDTAAACTYALPRAGKNIYGPSIRFAEMIAAAYGNLRTGARVIYNNGRVIVAQGVVHDLENNILHTEEVERRITDKYGKTYSEDMQVVAGRAACAVAFRNAIFKVVPAALVSDVYDQVQETARGTAETLPKRRKTRLDYFRRLGVKDDRIFSALEVHGEDDIDLDKIVILQSMVNSHKADGIDLDTLFPPVNPSNGKAKTAEAEADKKLNRKNVAGTNQAGKAATDQLAADMKSDKPQT